jgi:hypothetical protein
MTRPTPWAIAVLVTALAAPAAPVVAAPDAAGAAGRDEKYLRCESGAFGRYRECSADTENRVVLVRELSRNKCRQWNTWGYDRRGVWVDKGCRAEFRVGKDGGGGVGAGTAAVIGVVAGAAIIGAIVASKSRNDEHKDASPAPAWARGTFGGFSPKHDAELEVTIADDGRVTGTSGNDAISGHVSSGNRLHLGDLEFDMARESWGFAAKQRGDAESIVYFRRRG